MAPPRGLTPPARALETARLTLRPHRLEDFEDSAALWADPLVTRFIGGRPFTREESWARLLRYAGHWGLLDFGYWVIREAATGRFVGEAGFADFRRDIRPGFEGAPEIGWVLAPWAHGLGFATEAARAILAWGEVRFGPVRTVCIIDPDHAASLRVAAKCGYREAARATYHGRELLLLERRATVEP
jgi:RimJ/RimL family protein N-acetyltransferase